MAANSRWDLIRRLKS